MTTQTVRIADLTAAAGETTLVTIGLGSCVAIALHNPVHRIGALAHVLLPYPALPADAPSADAPSADAPSADAPSAGKCASTAVPAMLARMQALGAEGDVEARLVGGASMFGALLAPGAISLGARNVEAARAACAAHDVRIVGEAVGGDFGRSLYFDVVSGNVRVRTVRGDDVLL